MVRNIIRIGLDVGSTTAKAVAINADGALIFKAYERHNARIRETVTGLLRRMRSAIGNADVAFSATGSVGMGLVEKCSFCFVQEVVAAAKAISAMHPDTRTMIDIGGEDSKVVFFRDGQATDLRMNGNCAGGTGAFIDQMAVLLGVSTHDMNTLAENATTIHPIASRCGVFSKTDVQNLMSKNASKEDIAASIFHAVAVQVVVTLAHGQTIEPPVLLCGGPLTFLPALRKAFADYLRLGDDCFIVPSDSHLLPAIGAALSADSAKPTSLDGLIASVENIGHSIAESNLRPIFKDGAEHGEWIRRIENKSVRERPLPRGKVEAALGIDSGSTTTKIVAIDRDGYIIYKFYHNNDGDPIAAARLGLRGLQKECEANGTELIVSSCCSTGYGEELLKAAFALDYGIIETIAHYMAAQSLTDQVSFILDIGGQDMKAIFVSGGVINRLEVNEACSSGCGSFIETFAKSMGYGVADFAAMAARAKHPYDLGTRCTVFMNSKVKQALREGATVEDLAAGLSYSVVKNCLFKVLRLKNADELGQHIVVQGGTMKNDSVVRAFELLTERQVYRSSSPELMGAIGCALYAKAHGGTARTVGQLLDGSVYETASRQCHGCTNKCAVTEYLFGGSRHYYSGNRCEKVFSCDGEKREKGINMFAEKQRLLFGRKTAVEKPLLTIGIPRCLNQYEEYPFWHTLLSECGLGVILSSSSTFARYERCASQVMSDNICFPAKLVHSHIQDLVNKKVDRIFMPYVVYERQDGGQNSFNCPIVSGYSDVIKATEHGNVPIDSPAITFKDIRLLRQQCETYLTSLGIGKHTITKAFGKAVMEMENFSRRLAKMNRETLRESRQSGRIAIVLAGRPYHADPLIQHKLSDMVAAMGVDVLTEDIAREAEIVTDGVNFVPQWAYATRILKAAEWVACLPTNVQMMQMTSFGCGPDAFLTDETRTLLKRHGKTLTLLKIDDVSNIGSIKLRVRSAIDSLRLAIKSPSEKPTVPFHKTSIFSKADRRRKIIAPFFTPFISPLLPPLVKLAGYDVDCLPVSDAESGELGLRYANNEVCYPATLIVGDVVKAFRSGRYNPENTAVIMTQTGGQCRASNYLSLIKKALAEAGYGDVPVLSLASGSGIDNNQPGFRINWVRILPMVISTLIYSDSLAKLYYATLPREMHDGDASRLLQTYLDKGKSAIGTAHTSALWTLLAEAAEAFDSACGDGEAPRVGVVGEIFLKFNPFAQKGLTEWITEQGIEVVPPMLTDFFLQTFVNITTNQQAKFAKKTVPYSLVRLAYRLVWRKIEKANAVCGKRFRRFTPFESIFAKADEASRVVSLYAQFGEGWLLPGEVVAMARQGVTHVVSLQPFGCIANHIVAKGIEKRIKALCPNINLLSLDFDSGVSEVNVRNRMLLFIENLKNKNDNGEECLFRHGA